MATIEEWEAQGPYTMKALFGWVMHYRDSDYDFKKLLDRTFHLFVGQDLGDLIWPFASLTKAGYEVWKKVVGDWKPSKINEKLSDEQLYILACQYVFPSVDISEYKSFSNYARFKWLRTIRNHHRDKSPERK